MRVIRLLIPILAGLFMVLSINSLQAQEIRKVKIEELMNYIDSADHPLLVSFWATWCAPCVHEIPWLMASVDKYRSGRPELILVSLDFPESYPRGIASFIRSRNFKASFFWLDETNADHFCPLIDPKWTGGIPASLFINRATGYRQFFQRQLTNRQADQEVKWLVEGHRTAGH